MSNEEMLKQLIKLFLSLLWQLLGRWLNGGNNGDKPPVP